jgi:hypothetical protein
MYRFTGVVPVRSICVGRYLKPFPFTTYVGLLLLLDYSTFDYSATL